jgi:dCMP deaminase
LKTDTKKSAEHLAITKILNTYKHSAKKRKLSFLLNRKNIIDLIHKECAYCGAKNKNVSNTRNGVVTYNGIDRIDSKRGYELSNVIPCCKICNFMKNNLDVSTFYEHIAAIRNNRTKDFFQASESKLKYLYAKALAIASASPDADTKVGAILLDSKTGAVVAEGFNGFVRQAVDERLPNKRPDKYPFMIHAEMNAICHAARQGSGSDGHLLFCTLSPCKSCLRMLWQAGVKTIFFKEKYKDFDECISMLDLEVSLTKIGDFYHMLVDTRKRE